jgi:hypothetical protein
MADRKRDLALFNLTIDSKLRGCDVVALKVEDITASPPLAQDMSASMALPKGLNNSSHMNVSCKAPRLGTSFARNGQLTRAFADQMS